MPQSPANNPTAISADLISPCPHCLKLHQDPPSSVVLPSILDLRSTSLSPSLKHLVAQGLVDNQPRVVPGASPDDLLFAYSRSIDTLCLYSDAGLDIYEDITELQEYYPFPAELDILRLYGDEIAARMFGLPSQVLTEAYLRKTENGSSPGEGRSSTEHTPAANSEAPKEKWGDGSVGVNNRGVNGGLSVDSARVGLAVELGSGSLDKTKYLLRSLSKLLNSTAPAASFSSIEYRALDLEHDSLNSTLSKLLAQESSIVTHANDGTPRVVASGICATYDEGLAYLSNLDSSSAPVVKSLLWLGSSIGNFSRPDAADFLRNIAQNVLKEGDTMLIGIDNCDDPQMVSMAYDDPQGVTRRFILKGVDQAGKALHGVLQGDGGLASKNFDYVSRWNAKIGRHEAYVKCKVDNLKIPLSASGETFVTLKKDELVAIEVSYKYTQVEVRQLLDAAGVRMIQQWTDSRRLHSLYLIEKPSFYFPLVQEITLSTPPKVKHNTYGVPSLAEWEQMWKYWDTLTMEIIPRSILMTKPIPLRHIILFYTGHIPAFAGIHISRVFKEPLIDPGYFTEIFERGIDPDVTDPTKITHSHSIVPSKDDDWPSIQSILEYQGRVRERIRKVYAEHVDKMSRKLARVMFMIFEHEAMHAETLVYIALQASTLHQAPGRSAPDFASLSRGWDVSVEADGAARHSILRFSSTSVVIGHNDDDRIDSTVAYDSSHELGWDVENPQREVDVKQFGISATPISNQEYRDWLASQDFDAEMVLSSWHITTVGVLDAASISVKTLYGLVPFEFAKHWPACGSAHQLGSFAAAQGGRLPTQGELTLFFRSNPPGGAAGNIGLTNFHPVPATLPHRQRDDSVGCGSDGGVWMWSKDFLEPHEGYMPAELYPGYSSDFHDGTHQLVLGGSYATLPRLSRRTFVNWYQTKYTFVVAGARVVYD